MHNIIFERKYSYMFLKTFHKCWVGHSIFWLFLFLTFRCLLIYWGFLNYFEGFKLLTTLRNLINFSLFISFREPLSGKPISLTNFVMLHGLRTPNEAFFIETPNFWAWAGNLGRYILGHLGYFLANLSAPILVLWVPCPCFPLINHYVCKKLSLYLNIKYLFGIGIWIWATKN